MSLSELSLEEIVQRVAGVEPTPGAGPSLAWTCSLAAALVEMVCAVSLRQQLSDPSAVEKRGDRARALRLAALLLADIDAAAYQKVLAIRRLRAEPGHARRLREALDAANDPLLAIVEAAAEVTCLAADAAGQARGGVRGEAMAAAALGAAVVQAGIPLVELNLGGARDDPRVARARKLARAAESDRKRALGR